MLRPRMRTSTHINQQPTIWLIATIVLTALVYAEGLNGPFLFDDDPNIVRNNVVHIESLASDDWLALAQSGHSGPLKRPVSMLSFGVNHYLHGLDPFWFKATNLIIHILTGLALALLTRLLLRTPALAHIDCRTAQWIVVLVPAAWLLHPFNLTPVLYVVQRMSGLASLFVVLGLVAYTRGRLRMLEGERAWFGLISGTATFFVLALLSKETGASMFVYLLVVESLLFRFVMNSNNRRVLIGLWSAGLALLLLAILSYFLQHPNWAHNAYSFRSFDLGERLLTQSRAVCWYLYMLLVPNISQMGLHHDDFGISRSLFDPPATVFALGGIVLLVYSALYLRHKTTIVAFGILWFLGGHLLESTILPLELVVEHRNYLPGYGILLALFAVLLTTPVLRLRNQWRGLIAVAAIALLTTATYVRSHSWRSMDNLFANELANHPDSPRNNYLAGWLSLRQARAFTDSAAQKAALRQAEAYFQKALALDPRMGQAAVGLTCVNAEFQLENTNRSLDSVQRVFSSHEPTRGSIGALEWLTDCAMAYPKHISEEHYTAIMANALDSVRRSSERRADVLMQLVRYHGTHKKDINRSLKYISQALKLRPRASSLYLVQARYQLADGQLDAARKSLVLAKQYDRGGKHKDQVSYLENIAATLERNPDARIELN